MVPHIQVLFINVQYTIVCINDLCSYMYDILNFAFTKLWLLSRFLRCVDFFISLSKQLMYVMTKYEMKLLFIYGTNILRKGNLILKYRLTPCHVFVNVEQYSLFTWYCKSKMHLVKKCECFHKCQNAWIVIINTCVIRYREYQI